MSEYYLLDQASEDALHKQRLLNVEEKPFKRITKRLLSADSFITSAPSYLATPPPDGRGGEVETQQDDSRQQALANWRQFRDDVALDFAAFEGSIARIQFLLESNERERQRYADEKLKIQQTAQAVKANTTDLRSQLSEAQKELALRKTYDELAEKIMSNRLLKSRDQQRANLDKLNAEIAKLEQEREEYAKTWSERREQFGRIVEEGMNLRRLIRDEKEEVERREGMEDDDTNEDSDAGSTKGRAAGSASRSAQASHRPSSEVERPSPLQQNTVASQPTEPAKPQRQDEDENMVDEGEITGEENTDTSPRHGAGNANYDENRMDTT